MDDSGLVRRLGTRDAVVIGLGAMIGAGVFSAFAPAAAAAGAGLLIGMALAALVAYCNAAASAQLAAQYPVSGGTYYYGRQQLGHWWGFVAGWGFVTGKMASCAAMALTFATYAVPDSGWLQRLVGVAAVVTLTAANYRGITKTATLTRVLVTVTLLVLLLVVVLSLTGARTGAADLSAGTAWAPGGAYGILQAGGLLFFAFAGYARIATLGEEVRDPAVTIPRSIVIALATTVGVYLLIGASTLLVAGPEVLARSTAPLAAAVDAAGAGWAQPVVRAGAAVASLSSLLVLVAGIGRTSMAMARQADLPPWLAAVHPRYRVPHRAELLIAGVVIALVLTTDLREVIGFSSFSVLTYYGIANVSAFTQRPEHRRWPRALNIVGVIGCATLAFTLPPQAVVAALALFAIGIAGRAVVLYRRSS
ncbi:MAG: APC family permease [Streptosporangiales bacterium]